MEVWSQEGEAKVEVCGIAYKAVAWETNPLGCAWRLFHSVEVCGGLCWRSKGPAPGKDNRVPQRLSYHDRVEERMTQGPVPTVPRKCPGTLIPYTLHIPRAWPWGQT